MPVLPRRMPEDRGFARSGLQPDVCWLRRVFRRSCFNTEDTEFTENHRGEMPFSVALRPSVFSVMRLSPVNARGLIAQITQTAHWMCREPDVVCGTMRMLSERGRATKAGLTCLEVLVIIGIIAILAAVMLPPLAGQPHRDRKQIACLNRLRDIGNSMAMYLEDNRGKLPYAGLRYSESSRMAEYSWDDYLHPYLGGPRTWEQRRSATILTNGMKYRFDAFECPNDKVNRRNKEVVRRSYAMPRNHMGAHVINGRKPDSSVDYWSSGADTGVGIFLDGTGRPSPGWRPVDWESGESPPGRQRAISKDVVLDPEQTLLVVERIDDEQYAGNATRY